MLQSLQYAHSCTFVLETKEQRFHSKHMDFIRCHLIARFKKNAHKKRKCISFLLMIVFLDHRIEHQSPSNELKRSRFLLHLFFQIFNISIMPKDIFLNICLLNLQFVYFVCLFLYSLLKF